MAEFFSEYSRIIIFLHVISAVIWVGGMIAIRVAVHPSLQTVDEVSIRLGKSLMIMKRLFLLVLPFIVILLATAVVIAVGLDFKHSSLYGVVQIKEGIWTIMVINYGYMFFQRSKAQKLFDSGDLSAAKAKIAKIPTLFLPINIFLGIVAIYLGVMLRGY